MSVQDPGELLAVEAEQVDDVRRGMAIHRFDLESPSASLIPGAAAEAFDRPERDGEQDRLVIRGDRRTDRSTLHGLAWR